MKKYIEPALEMIELNVQSLLAGSTTIEKGGNYDGKPIESRRGFFGDEEDSEEYKMPVGRTSEKTIHRHPFRKRKDGDYKQNN